MNINDATNAEFARTLFDEYTQRWSASRRARFDAMNPHEPDISALIAALLLDAGRAATDYLLTAGGDEPDRGMFDYYLISDSDWMLQPFLREERADGTAMSRITPDIFICRVSKETDRTEIVTAVELKLDAAVNYINCPAGRHEGYSNQLVCYPQGCWLKDAEACSGIGYVWLAPRDRLSDEAICKRALTGDPVRHEKLYATQEAYERQMDALERCWARAPLEGLIDAIRPSAPQVAKVIGQWARL